MRPPRAAFARLQDMPTLEPIWGLDITRLTFN
jgi:hypothetical protein